MQMRKKIMLVFGTRPEAIKMAPLVHELKKHTQELETLVCVTGQHREMLDQVLDIFDIRPDYDLNIMRPGQDLTDVTTSILLGMRSVLQEAQPHIVLVHGDTATSTGAALAAFYARIPVGHVEAGLRTYDMYSPYPEEINRQLTGRIASYHFAPTALSTDNLKRELVNPSRIITTGNTVIDALHLTLERIEREESLRLQLVESISSSGYNLDRLSTGERRLVLITGHRRENFGEGFIHICQAIKTLCKRYPDVDFLYPMHLNPNVRGAIHEVFGLHLEHRLSNMFFIEPQQYLEFALLLSKAYIILTDSGGIQEEAPSLGKPVLVMRDTTERPEALTAGVVRLVGTDYERIIAETSLLLDDKLAYAGMAHAGSPYGDGKASQRIADFLINTL